MERGKDRKEKMCTLTYADDIVLIATREKKMRSMIKKD